jgi:hypothetical protein
MKAIKKCLLDGRNSNNEHIVKIVEPMQVKFDKYWAPMEDFAAITLIFDPRYKTELLTFLLAKDLGSVAAEMSVTKTKKNLYTWFTSYATSNGVPNQSTSASKKDTDIQCLTNDPDDEFKKYLATKNSTHQVSPTAELDLYLQQPTVAITQGPPHFDLLKWWKEHSNQYPNLARMAQNILMVPMTSIASESAFSTGGRVLNDYRSRLAPSMVEVLICGQNWLNEPIDDNEEDEEE